MDAPHQHSQIELNVLLDGEMTYLFGGREVRLVAGEFAFFWGASPHQSVAVAPGTRFICIYVPFDRFLGLPLSARLTASVMSGGVIAATDATAFDPARFLRLHEELSGDDSSLVELDRAEIEHMLRRVDLTGWRDLLGGQETPAGRPTAHAKAVAMARFMTEHATKPIDVADVARKTGLHPNYAMTVFRNSFGLTIGTYLLRQRLHRAQALLAATDAPVSAVAFESGFGSVSRFHAAFRENFGISPRRFRAQRSAARAERVDRGRPLTFPSWEAPCARAARRAVPWIKASSKGARPRGRRSGSTSASPA